MSGRGVPSMPRTARALAVLGMVLLGIGVVLGVFESPARAPRIVLVVLGVLGVLCIVVPLLVAELDRR